MNNNKKHQKIILFNSLKDVENFILEDDNLKLIESEVAKRNEQDSGHDIGHCHRVAFWTIRLLEGKSNINNAIAASLLHDFVNLRKDDPKRALASEMSAKEARKLLSTLPRQDDFSEEDIDDICLAIRDHSFSRGAIPETELGKALQDADRLEALGVLGSFRNISCGVQMKTKFFHDTDPWAQNRPLDDKKFSVDHYHVKLFKLENTMNTIAGKQEARKRTARLEQMLIDLGDELGIPYVQPSVSTI